MILDFIRAEEIDRIIEMIEPFRVNLIKFLTLF